MWRRARFRPVVAACALTAVGIAGCGAGASGGDRGTASAGGSGPARSFTGANAEFCNAYAAFAQVLQDAQHAKAAADNAALKESLRTFAADAKTLERTLPVDAPVAVRTSFTQYAVGLAWVARNQSMSPADRRKLAAAGLRVDSYVAATCPAQ